MPIFLLASSIFLSQFYLIRSGLPQVSHFLLLTFSFLSLYIVLKNKSLNLTYTKSLLFFLTYALFINLLFSIFYENLSFLFASLYWIFNFITLLAIANYVTQDNFKYIEKVLILSLSVLFFICLLKLGRFDFYPRFNAFFNDPNQMAFWAICILASYTIISKRNIFIDSILFGFCSYIIVVSMSRSGLIGLILLFVSIFYSLFVKSYRQTFLLLLAFSVAGIIWWLAFQGGEYHLENDGLLSMMDRVESTDSDKQWDLRGYNLITDYPQYLLFGSGQGGEYRFLRTHEIHSSWAGLIFYYGFIGLTIFGMFLFSILRKLPVISKVAFCAPIIYGFSTYGLRTPVFWFFIGLSIISIKNYIKNRN